MRSLDLRSFPRERESDRQLPSRPWGTLSNMETFAMRIFAELVGGVVLAVAIGCGIASLLIAVIKGLSKNASQSTKENTDEQPHS